MDFEAKKTYSVEWHHNGRGKDYVYDLYSKYTSELIYIEPYRVMCFGPSKLHADSGTAVARCDFNVVFPKYGIMNFEAKFLFGVEWHHNDRRKVKVYD